MIIFVTTTRGKKDSSQKFRNLTPFIVVDRSLKAVKNFGVGLRKRHEEQQQQQQHQEQEEQEEEDEEESELPSV